MQQEPRCGMDVYHGYQSARAQIGSERIFVCKMIRKWWKKPNKTKGWHLQAFQKILNVAIDIVFTSASIAG